MLTLNHTVRLFAPDTLIGFSVDEHRTKRAQRNYTYCANTEKESIIGMKYDMLNFSGRISRIDIIDITRCKYGCKIVMKKLWYNVLRVRGYFYKILKVSNELQQTCVI